MRQSRRQMLKTSLAGVAAVGGGGAASAFGQPAGSRPNPAPAVGSARMNGPLFFDVETSSGVVRGIANTGIRIFRGIPYGADTGGKNRFMPPKKPAKWSGVRNCLGYT